MSDDRPATADLSAETRPLLSLTTADPRFEPTEALTVNGFTFVPASKPVSVRIRSRIAAARSLADDLAGDGETRMAQVIRDLCNSAQSCTTVNSTLHAELMEARKR
jgi:hypothetical protein